MSFRLQLLQYVIDVTCECKAGEENVDSVKMMFSAWEMRGACLLRRWKLISILFLTWWWIELESLFSHWLVLHYFNSVYSKIWNSFSPLKPYKCHLKFHTNIPQVENSDWLTDCEIQNYLKMYWNWSIHYTSQRLYFAFSTIFRFYKSTRAQTNNFPMNPSHRIRKNLLSIKMMTVFYLINFDFKDACP